MGKITKYSPFCEQISKNKDELDYKIEYSTEKMPEKISTQNPTSFDTKAKNAVSVTQNNAIHKRATGAFQDSFTPEDVVDYYQKWASKYDQEINNQSVYQGSNNVANTISKMYPSGRENVRILDVAAGTGIVGERLYDLGFRNMDALDPSDEMLKLCEPKKLYKNLICEYMTDNVTSIDNDSYDVIVSSGGMGNGHIPRSALNEMVRIVKQGGFICIAMREEFLTLTEEYNNNKLEGLMADLEKAGKWRKVERKLIDYLRNAVGVMFLYQVL